MLDDCGHGVPTICGKNRTVKSGNVSHVSIVSVSQDYQLS